MKSQHVNPRGLLLTLFTIALALLTPAVAGGASQQLHDHVPAAAKALKPVDRLPAGKHLILAIGLPLRNQAELNELLRDICDPASPKYRHYLTPEQFAEKFGPTRNDYQAVIDFARKHGLAVTNTHPNRLIVDVDGATADVEKAFGVKMRVFQHPREARTFYAPDTEPTLDLAVPISHISGLDNYSLPHPLLKQKPLGMEAGATPQSGSGPSGAYAGGDFRAAYVPGTTLTGAGQSVGLLQFDGYYASDIAAYKTQFGLPNVPLVIVPIDGGVTTPGDGNSEVCLDIEMVMSMAPGVSTIYVYEAPNPSPWVDLLNRMATDNLAKQISCSWGGGSADATAETIFQQMAAQGQSFFCASGDSDAFTGSITFPADSPNITQVGGTTLYTSGAGGSYLSETVWNWGNDVGSCGGISTYYSIPSWQQSTSMSANQGSTTMRNVPDVALTADNVYVAYNNGGTGAFGGTSCAAPLWAGFTALVNQQAVAAGRSTVGFINPAIYTIGNSSGYSAAFHDTTTGNNFSSSSPTKFSAVAGYDLCTGWGTPTGSALIDALAGPADYLQVSNLSFVAGGDVGGPMTPTSISYTLTNNGSSALNWTAANTQTWTTLSATGGTLAPGANTTVTWSLNSTAVNELPAGNYSDALTFTNSTSGVKQVRTLSLTIVTPTAPTITTASPLPSGNVGVGYSQALAASGGWTPYTWSITSGSLPAGLSLSSAGVISGLPTAATTASLTVQVTGSDNLSSTKNFSLTIAPNLGPFFDDFEPGIDLVQWSAFGGTVGSTVLACNYGGSVSGSNSLWFGDAGSRYAASRSLNTALGGVVDFWLRLANGASSPWENVDLPGEGVVLEYSIDSGSSWVEFGRYDTSAYWVWTHLTVNIPVAAQTTNTRFRWRQLSNSGSGYDHWALDDVAVLIGPHGPTITTTSPMPSGTVGTAYSQTLAASGGATPYTWSITSGNLPAGLGLSSAGVISGTPTAATTASFTVQVTGGDSLFSTRIFNLTIVGPVAPTITTASPLPSGGVGTAYSQTLVASGGQTPYSWSITSGSLPAGLGLSSTGVISGTPTAATTASFTVQVAGSDSLSSTKIFNLTIAGPGGPLAVALNQPTLIVTTSGNLPWFSQSATTHDGVAAAQSGAITDSQQSVMETTVTGPGTFSFWWKVSSESSFDYLTFYLDGVAQSGAISGTVDWQQKSYTVTAGSHDLKWIYSKDVSVSVGSDCGWVDQLTLPLPTAPTITTTSPLPSGTTGTAYSQIMAASGGSTPYTWSITSGSLPAGLSLSSAGVISGIPSAGTSASFTVQVMGSDGLSSTKNFSLTIVSTAPTITTSSPLPSGTVGIAYSQTLAASGGTTPYIWSIASGSLPAGFIMSITGVISGFPTAPSTSSFTVQVAGNDGLSSTKAFSLTILPPVAPTITTSSPLPVGTVGAAYSQALAASGGTTPYIWSIASGSLPAGLSLSSAGVISGTPTAASTASFTVQVAGNDSLSSTKPFNLTIGNTTYTITASARGWYDLSGAHDPANTNYSTGGSSSHGEVRSFYVFTLPTLATGETVVSAQLRLWNPASGYISPDATETLQIYQVTTPIASLVAGTGGIAAFTDLGDGTVLGNAKTVSAADDSTTIVVPLNDAFAQLAKQTSGNGIALGGAITSLSHPGSNEAVFGYSGSSSTDTQLVLTTSTVPTIPVIAVEQPVGTPVSNGGTKGFGPVAVGANSSLTFTLKNTGNADLNLTGTPKVAVSGTNAADFTVTAQPSSPVSGPSGSTTFTVEFTPGALGSRSAALSIASNDATNNPYAINLTGSGMNALQTWRQAWFGSIDNSGDGADLSDPDHDGIPNLAEFAFGLDPTHNSAGLLPRPQIVGSNYVISFTEPSGVSGITYAAEWSQTLLPGSWTSVSDTGVSPQHTFSVPMGTNTQLFMRMKVTDLNP